MEEDNGNDRDSPEPVYIPSVVQLYIPNFKTPAESKKALIV